MADKDDEKYVRREPPKDHEWPHIFDGIEKSHKAWIVVGPLHAIISNWKALAAIIVFLAWLNQPKIVAALAVLTGVTK